jgi:aspartyl-tRNA(Asn)/glutamyl-tRNA(Gln) amidotransferase subunit C
MSADRPMLNFHLKVMALNLDEVKKIAALARLRFAPEEEKTFTAQLGAIVDYIDQLQRMATAGGETGGGAASRESDDRPLPCLPRERFLANAPASTAGFLLVPEIPSRRPSAGASVSAGASGQGREI